MTLDRKVRRTQIRVEGQHVRVHPYSSRTMLIVSCSLIFVNISVVSCILLQFEYSIICCSVVLLLSVVFVIIYCLLYFNYVLFQIVFVFEMNVHRKQLLYLTSQVDVRSVYTLPSCDPHFVELHRACFLVVAAALGTHARDTSTLASRFYSYSCKLHPISFTHSTIFPTQPQILVLDTHANLRIVLIWVLLKLH